MNKRYTGKASLETLKGSFIIFFVRVLDGDKENWRACQAKSLSKRVWRTGVGMLVGGFPLEWKLYALLTSLPNTMRLESSHYREGGVKEGGISGEAKARRVSRKFSDELEDSLPRIGSLVLA